MANQGFFVALAVAATLSLAGHAVAQGRAPTDRPRVSAAEVILYIDDSPCQGAVDVAEIAVQQESMTLSDVLRALRLEAAHRGANGVKDIRVAPGGEGRFRVSGTAIRCGVARAPETAPNPAPQPRAAPRPRGTPGPQGTVAPIPGLVDSKVAEFLGPAFIEILTGADNIESVHLGGRGAGGESMQTFGVVGHGRALTSDQVRRLRALILDAKSYLFDSSKRCPFIADVGFIVHRGHDRASVALATRCNLWSFSPSPEPGRPAIEDFDPAATALKSLVAEVLGK